MWCDFHREFDSSRSSLSDGASDDDMPLMLPTDSGGSVRKVSRGFTPTQPVKFCHIKAFFTSLETDRNLRDLKKPKLFCYLIFGSLLGSLASCFDLFSS